MGEKQLDYFQILGFEHVYLEDSFVLDIKSKKKIFEFRLEVVLTEKHPLYHAPLANEQYCYRDGIITFPKLTTIEWVSRSPEKYIDATGQIDYGHIDSFVKVRSRYHLEGDWGEVFISSDVPILTFANLES